jgi:hypothetical protein
MRIAEFNRAAEVYHKRSLFACVTPLLIALACMVAYAPFKQRFEGFLSSRFHAFPADVLSILPLALPLVTALLLLVPMARRIDRRFGISCVHCGKQLANHKPIVIASRNCPYCGKPVIEENPEQTCRV